MEKEDKIKLLDKSKGLFIIINDYKPKGSIKSLTISGIIENVDRFNGDISIRNIRKNEIRCISIDSFNNDFVIKSTHYNQEDSTNKEVSQDARPTK